MPPKYTIFKDFEFAAAHAIRGHQGGCQNLHGHNYRVRVHVSARELDRLSMVIDFADLKAVIAEAAGRFDHRVINEIPPFDRINTTAERIAGHLYREVSERLAERLAQEGGEEAAARVAVERVEVWETPTSCAIYEED